MTEVIFGNTDSNNDYVKSQTGKLISLTLMPNQSTAIVGTTYRSVNSYSLDGTTNNLDSVGAACKGTFSLRADSTVDTQSVPQPFTGACLLPNPDLKEPVISNPTSKWTYGTPNTININPYASTDAQMVTKTTLSGTSTEEVQDDLTFSISDRNNVPNKVCGWLSLVPPATGSKVWQLSGTAGGTNAADCEFTMTVNSLARGTSNSNTVHVYVTGDIPSWNTGKNYTTNMKLTSIEDKGDAIDLTGNGYVTTGTPTGFNLSIDKSSDNFGNWTIYQKNGHYFLSRQVIPDGGDHLDAGDIGYPNETQKKVIVNATNAVTGTDQPQKATFNITVKGDPSVAYRWKGTGFLYGYTMVNNQTYIGLDNLEPFKDFGDGRMLSITNDKMKMDFGGSDSSTIKYYNSNLGKVYVENKNPNVDYDSANTYFLVFTPNIPRDPNNGTPADFIINNFQSLANDKTKARTTISSGTSTNPAQIILDGDGQVPYWKNNSDKTPITKDIKFSQIGADSNAVKLDPQDIDMGDDKNNNTSFIVTIDNTSPNWDIKKGSDNAYYLVRKLTQKDGVPHISADDVETTVTLNLGLKNSVSQRLGIPSKQRKYTLNVKVDNSVSFIWTGPKIVLKLGTGTQQYYPGNDSGNNGVYLQDNMGSVVVNSGQKMIVDNGGTISIYRFDCTQKGVKMDNLISDLNNNCPAYATGTGDDKVYLVVGSHLRFNNGNPTYSSMLYLNNISNKAYGVRTGDQVPVPMLDGSNPICLQDSTHSC